MLSIEEHKDALTFRHEAMATDFWISIVGEEPSYAKQASHEAFTLIDSIEQKLSLYQEVSDVTRINRAKVGESITISEECNNCLQLAIEASELTGGAYHAFVGLEASRIKGNIPAFLRPDFDSLNQSELAEPAIELDPVNRRVFKRHQNSILDLGGIGKGYALDQVKQLFEEWEVRQALFNAGGSTILFICPNSARGWDARLGSLGNFELRECALASSGLGFQSEHIVNPAKGVSETRWIRSYVLAETAAMADALSTGIMNLNQEQIEGLLRHTDRRAFAVESSDGITTFGDFKSW